MDFLSNTLGVTVEYKEWNENKAIPFFIVDNYNFKVATIDGLETLFIYLKNDIESMVELKKHISLIGKNITIPPVLVMKRCTSRQRSLLIRERIAFIIEKQQIYLPFLAIFLQEKFSKQNKKHLRLFPSTQAVLFYYIYSKKKGLLMAELSKKLPYSPMSISRAIKQLEDLSLIYTYKKGLNKIISSEFMGEELYREAEAFLISPIDRIVYVKKHLLNDNYLISSYTALSKRSELAHPRSTIFAVLKSDIIDYEIEYSNETSEVEVEAWLYSPKLFGPSEYVDVLSLHQALKNDTDERVQSEVENMMRDFWKEYQEEANDKRFG